MKPEDVQRTMVEIDRLNAFLAAARQAGADIPMLAQQMIYSGGALLTQLVGPDYARAQLGQAMAFTFAVPSSGGKA